MGILSLSTKLKDLVNNIDFPHKKQMKIPYCRKLKIGNMKLVLELVMASDNMKIFKNKALISHFNAMEIT